MAKKKLQKNYLDGVPVRAKDVWRERDDGLVEIDLEHTGFYAMLAQKIFGRPRVSHIALDEYGSVVWKHMDGTNTVYELVRMMEQRFPEAQDRMLDRVVTYLATLQNNGFVRLEEAKK